MHMVTRQYDKCFCVLWIYKLISNGSSDSTRNFKKNKQSKSASDQHMVNDTAKPDNMINVVSFCGFANLSQTDYPNTQEKKIKKQTKSRFDRHRVSESRQSDRCRINYITNNFSVDNHFKTQKKN